MEHELKIKELRDGLFLLDEGGEATGYLLVGAEKACLIDTMNGYNDLKKVTETLTDKPVVVVNTHGHPDHIFGNVFFDQAFMNEADLELAEEFIHMPEFEREMDASNLKMPPFSNIKEGDVLELGGRTLKVYELPGHTPGGIVLLCPEERILFTGDSINHHLWMQLEGCSPIEVYIEKLERLTFLLEEADYILHGHARDLTDISLLTYLIEGLKEIVEGKTEEDTPYYYFEGTREAVYHPFKVSPDIRYESAESGIVYNG